MLAELIIVNKKDNMRNENYVTNNEYWWEPEKI